MSSIREKLELADRLREAANWRATPDAMSKDMFLAADEITRLTEALDTISKIAGHPMSLETWRIFRAFARNMCAPFPPPTIQTGKRLGE